MLMQKKMRSGSKVSVVDAGRERGESHEEGKCKMRRTKRGNTHEERKMETRR